MQTSLTWFRVLSFAGTSAPSFSPSGVAAEPPPSVHLATTRDRAKELPQQPSSTAAPTHCPARALGEHIVAAATCSSRYLREREGEDSGREREQGASIHRSTAPVERAVSHARALPRAAFQRSWAAPQRARPVKPGSLFLLFLLDKYQICAP